jgi:hypothetical protein
LIKEMNLLMLYIALMLGVALGSMVRKYPTRMGIGLVVSVLALSSTVASAANEADPVTRSGTIVIPATGVTVLIAVFIPIVTGILTRRTTSSFLKGLITLAANGIVSAVTTATLADGTALISWQFFVTWFIGFVTSVGLYTGLWLPAGVTSSDVPVRGADGTVTTYPGKLSNVGVK